MEEPKTREQERERITVKAERALIKKNPIRSVVNSNYVMLVGKKV